MDRRLSLVQYLKDYDGLHYNIHFASSYVNVTDDMLAVLTEGCDEPYTTYTVYRRTRAGHLRDIVCLNNAYLTLFRDNYERCKIGLPDEVGELIGKYFDKLKEAEDGNWILDEFLYTFIEIT